MKTFSKTIYENEFTSNSKWGQRIISYIKIQRHFDFKEGLRYSVATPNFACCAKKKSDALLRAIEHEGIGMAKYEVLKEQLHKNKLWNVVC